MTRWEVWVSDDCETWRFNACFEHKYKADAEAEWYFAHGYDFVDVRARTTRYQQNRHRTTGG